MPGKGLGGARVQLQRIRQVDQHVRLDVHLTALLDLLQRDQRDPGEFRQIILVMGSSNSLRDSLRSVATS